MKNTEPQIENNNEKIKSYTMIGKSQINDGSIIIVTTKSESTYFFKAKKDKEGLISLEVMDQSSNKRFIGYKGYLDGCIKIEEPVFLKGSMNTSPVETISASNIKPDTNLQKVKGYTDFLEGLSLSEINQRQKDIYDNLSKNENLILMKDIKKIDNSYLFTRKTNEDFEVKELDLHKKVSAILLKLFDQLKENKNPYTLSELNQMLKCFSKFLDDYVKNPGGMVSIPEVEFTLEGKKFLLKLICSLYDSSVINFDFYEIENSK